MDPKTGRPAQAHIHRRMDIYRTKIYPLDRLMNMIVAGEISDALAILSLHRTWFHLRSNIGLGQRP